MEFDPKELDQWTRAALAPELTDREKDLRNRFVEEFIIDYDKTGAALRCGFAKSFATDYADKFLSEPYVRQRIVERERELGTEENAVERDRLLILSALRKEIAMGSPASRVSAATQLAKLQGLEPASKTISEVTVKSPVQFYLPHNGRDPIAEERIVVTDPLREGNG